MKGAYGSVPFGSLTAMPVSWTDTEVVVTVPTSVSGPVRVQQNNVPSNGIAFTYDQPTVTAATPNSGAPSAQITITGSRFGPVKGNYGNVILGNHYATVVSWSDTQVVATVPTGATGTANVAQNGVWSNGVPFTVLPVPTLTGISPNSGVAGTLVTLTGTNLGASQGAGIVSFNGIPATPTSWSATSISVPVPNGATTGNVMVMASGVTAGSLPFTVPLPTPVLSQITPTSGVLGTLITLTGSNFGITQGDSQVMIAGIPLSVTSWSENTITATMSDEVITGEPLPVTVVTSAGTSNELQFTANDPPVSGVTLTPDKASMVVGETRTFQAMVNGAVLSGLTWTTSDPTILQLSTDDPPVVTALTPGEVTLTANDATATITVYADALLPVGTVKWSVPGDGSGVTQILPAIPSSTGVADVFAMQGSGKVIAITADGVTAWTSSLVSAP